MEDIFSDRLAFGQHISPGADLFVQLPKTLMIVELVSHIVKLLSLDGEKTWYLGHGSQNKVRIQVDVCTEDVNQW